MELSVHIDLQYLVGVVGSGDPRDRFLIHNLKGGKPVQDHLWPCSHGLKGTKNPAIALVMTDSDLSANKSGVIHASDPSATLVFKKFKALGLGTREQ